MAAPNKPKLTLEVDAEGRLAFPETLRKRWGLTPHAAVEVRTGPQGLLLFPQDPPMAKIYLEPTSRCNLACHSCIRSSWDEPTGMLSSELFERLIASLKRVPSFSAMSFWGMGEPLLHPRIAEMVASASALGAETELVTNGLLLSRDTARDLIAAGLDRLIVSVDGASPEGHAAGHGGADLATVQENVRELRLLRHDQGGAKPEIGIELVLGRGNLAELKRLRRLAFEMGAAFIILTNLMPYVEELKEEILYWMAAEKPWTSSGSPFSPRMIAPRVDARPENLAALNELFWSGCAAEPTPPLSRNPDADGHCRFVEQGAAAVAWDGGVSPCIPLMHSYRCFVLGREKRIRRWTVGHIATEEIGDIWNREEYRAFRRRVLEFDFSPCVHCGGCDFSESNEEDCFGNRHPTCGDCLWARNIIVCP